MKNKKKAIALAALLGVGAVGGTLAYFNQTLTAENVFDTGIYDTELVEDFKPSEGENWEPGATVNKDVIVQNTGTLPVVIRVKFEEKWVRKDETDPYHSIDTVLTKDDEAKGKDAAGEDARNRFESIYQVKPGEGETEPDGDTEGDDSVVIKYMDPDHMWVYNPLDGYYYYKNVIPGKDSDGTIHKTEKILDGVTLIENVDMGLYDEMKSYTTYVATSSDAVPADEWHEFPKAGDEYISTKALRDELKNEEKEITFLKSKTNMDKGHRGYSDSDYILTVTAQTVQATNHAVATVFDLKGADGKFELPDTMKDEVNWVLTDEDEVQSSSENN